MMLFFKISKIFFLILRYRLFFLIGVIPYLGFLKYFFNPNSASQALRLRLFLEKLGPSFIKLGQILSVRSDLVGDIFCKELSFLREDCKKSNNKYIEKAILQAFSDTNHIKENLINITPIAIGSVAEVYKLYLSNTPVAIKVLKPNIRRHFKQNIDLLRKIFIFAEKNIQQANKSKILKVIELLEKISNFELDLRFEAAAASEVADNFKEIDMLYIPKVYWKFSSKDVLVTEWVNGYKIYSTEELKKNNIKTDLILKHLAKIFFLQVIKYGFFHGDLHPGNIIITKDQKIAMVDFGIMGRLSYLNRIYVGNVWKSFLNQDYKQAASIHFKANWVSSNYKQEDMALAIRAIMDPLLLSGNKNISIASFMQQLFDITRIFGMEIQSELLLVQKNMLLLEGISRMLSKDTNIWLISKDILNTSDFKLTNTEKVKYSKNYFQNVVTENIKCALENFSYYNQKSPSNNLKVTKKERFSFFSFTIIILLFIIILILLLKA